MNLVPNTMKYILAMQYRKKEVHCRKKHLGQFFDCAQSLQCRHLQKPKMSEYLSGNQKEPKYISAHIETFDNLADVQAT